MRLPEELMATIAGLLSKEDQLALALTSKSFYAHAVRWIYRVLRFFSAAQVLKCCTTILSRPNIAACAIAFIFDYESDVENTLTSEDLTKVANAIKEVTRVELLDVSPALALVKLGLLDDISLPSLRICTLPYGDFSKFLPTNPRINKLIIQRSAPGNSLIELAHYIGQTDVHDFFGPTEFAYSILPGSVIKHLGLVWNKVPGKTTNDILQAVAQTTVPLVGLEIFADQAEVEWLPAIATHLRDLVRLNITFWSQKHIISHQDMVNFLSSFTQAIPELNNLTDIDISNVSDAKEFTAQQLWELHDLVLQWGSSQPSLRRCTLHFQTKWIRLRDNIWVPKYGQDGWEVRARWIAQALERNLLPQDLFEKTEITDGMAWAYYKDEYRPLFNR
ncbi:hypothetical protein AX16_010266 [Volvariella volvacea WC 439]|nr:hypothetical protein AX16_010266 [Volvariella volvacea WC 439]